VVEEKNAEELHDMKNLKDALREVLEDTSANLKALLISIVHMIS
jgi:hypothetical protein